MRIIILLSSLFTWYVAAVAGGNSHIRSAVQQKYQRLPYHLTKPRQIVTAWRGGDLIDMRRSSDNVDVSPDRKLPGSIAGKEIQQEENSSMCGDLAYAPGASGSTEQSAVSKKIASLKERTLPAVLMMGGAGLWAYYMKEDGLIFLTLILQIGMYQEMTKVIGGSFPHQFYKWYWFTTASVALNAPRMFPWAANTISAVVLGMSVLGIMMSIVGFNWRKAPVEEFREYLRQAAVAVLSLILVMVPSSYWISTLEEFGMKWVVLPLVLVIVNDTMAYFFGIAFGKHPLLPVISPKKTWEGFLGATLSTIAVSYDMFPTKRDGLILATFASLVGPFGGFLASVIKRAYNQKDFGALFPGHGGLVDRLDCQLIMAPIVYLYLSLTGDYDAATAQNILHAAA